MRGLSIRRLWMIAYRDLGRNRRRSLLTMVAVALGLGLLIVTAGLVEGELAGALESSIRLQTGHLQLRAESYDEDKLSLEWDDLLPDAQWLAAQVQAIPNVRVATPMLWASGILSTRDETVGVRVVGMDPLSEAYSHIREGIVAGEYLTPEDRSGILISQRLAADLGLAIGQELRLMVSTADEQPDEAVFTIRGLFNTGFPSYDNGNVFLPLAKAQAFTRTEGRASTIFILLHRQEDTDAVATALAPSGLKVITWRDLNQILLQAFESSMGIMYIMYLVVLGVVAVVIANTLLMAVFERTREMGILAALGMKGRQILLMFLLETGTLAVAGIILGLILGSLGVGYLATYGWYIGSISELAGSSVTFGTSIYARFAPSAMAGLSIACLVITLLASLYPAWHASRLEPIDALRAL